MVSCITQVEKFTSWKDIKAASDMGFAMDLPKSGDLIPITLNDGEIVMLVATYDGSGKLYFVFRDCLDRYERMNETNTNNGGWAACYMRKTHARRTFNRLPEDLKAVIKPTKIVQVIDGERIECEDKLFCLSATQVFGPSARWSESEPEDTQLDIFKGRRDRIKTNRLGNDLVSWWLRSPDTGGTTGFRYVSSGGSSYGYYAGYSYGVCFGFCI